MTGSTHCCQLDCCWANISSSGCIKGGHSSTDFKCNRCGKWASNAIDNPCVVHVGKWVSIYSCGVDLPHWSCCDNLEFKSAGCSAKSHEFPLTDGV